MANLFNSRMSQIKKGAVPEVDFAIINALLQINQHRNHTAYSMKERIWKFLNINDALDGLEGLIDQKLTIGHKAWKEEHDKIKLLLDNPMDFAYSDPNGFNKVLIQRHKLYVDALSSLGYAATERELDNISEVQNYLRTREDGY
jgi:hypothetical protein